jgi:hypothetical protein
MVDKACWYAPAPARLARSVAILVFLLGLGTAALAADCTTHAYFNLPGADATIRAAILQAINGARTSIDLALYQLTDDQLCDAVVRASRRGVAVRVLLDARQQTAWGGEADKLVSGRVPLAFAPASDTLGHCFGIIDGRLVITGSYQWTQPIGERRYDSVLFIDCRSSNAAPTIAQIYAAQFNDLWAGLGGAQGAGERAPIETGQAGASAVVINRVDPAGQCVELLNVSRQTVDLSGWGLGDFEGQYTFPDKTLLDPDDPLQVCAQTYNPTHDPNGLWLEATGDEVFLVNPVGTIVDEVVWGTH